jgi:hypothetical protein
MGALLAQDLGEDLVDMYMSFLGREFSQVGHVRNICFLTAASRELCELSIFEGTAHAVSLKLCCEHRLGHG